MNKAINNCKISFGYLLKMASENKKMKKSTKVIIMTTSIIVGLIIVLLIAFFSYTAIYYRASSDTDQYIKDNSININVKEEGDYISFSPKSNSKNKGLIFYPGGKVEYKAYEKFTLDLANKGVTTIICKMPFNLAFFKINAADNKKELFPTISSWYISGHSLGGVSATVYLESHSKEYDGLILLASYSTKNLSSCTFKTLSLLASNDKVLNYTNYNANKGNLPNLTEKIIEGGIHSYFGDYGIQKKDGVPSITCQEQRRQVVESITTFIGI